MLNGYTVPERRRAGGRWAGALVLALAAWHPARAYLDFYGYQAYRDNDSAKTIRYQQVRLGGVQLESCEIRIDPKGSYLDVTEDAWASGNVDVTQLGGLTGDWVLKGGLPVPYKAAVAGLEAWKDGVPYRAKLYPAQYIVDRRYPDSVSLRQALSDRVALLQQLGEDSYEATFAGLALGERKHIRVRYLLPNTGAGAGRYSVPVLFHSPYGSPQFLKLTVLADAARRPFTVDGPTGAIQLRDSSSVLLPYQQNLSLRLDLPVATVLHRGDFQAGDWSGHYLLLNASTPDSLIARLSRPLTTMFIWRWNAATGFVSAPGGVKGLTDYAREVLAQARRLRQAVSILAARGHQAGLVLDVAGQSPRAFAPGGEGDANLRALEAYLDSLDERYLYARYSDQPEQRPDWVPLPLDPSGSTATDRGREEFLSSLKRAEGLVDPKPGADSLAGLHIALLSAGPAATGLATLKRATLDSLLRGATLDASQAQWPGVDFSAAVAPQADQHLFPWLGFYFPAFQPSTILLKAFAGRQPFAFPLTVDSLAGFAVAAKAAGAWKDSLRWIGFDPAGRVTDSVDTKPWIYDVPADSGLAKVWARDGSHAYESAEDDLGARYGIVTKATFLRAGAGDRDTLGGQGLAFLSPDEIHVPLALLPQIVTHEVRIPWSYAAGRLSLRSGDGDAGRLEVFDLRGRLLLSLDPGAYREGGWLRVPLERLLGPRFRGVAAMRWRGRGFAYGFKLRIGGGV